MPGSDRSPLPVNMEEARRRGWDELDIVLVNGDAYVDHPSFGLAIIGRLLESHGYRVGILAQPSFADERDFRRFGRPRLFFGISGGNLDSVVANYSANGKVRDFDAYSPGGSPWRDGQKGKEHRWRPDRAVLLYSNLARRAFPATPIILGGLEASLRRFVHFDFQQQRLRGSHLSDAKADLLIYGMAERAVLEAAERVATGRALEGIPGTCQRTRS
ncbi:MAG: YgiQ family radical SAM protein, partial [Desulfofustis sp.]|nr:YgiQ family radical SAM protein [Desulfofustis sp.]